DAGVLLLAGLARALGLAGDRELLVAAPVAGGQEHDRADQREAADREAGQPQDLGALAVLGRGPDEALLEIAEQLVGVAGLVEQLERAGEVAAAQQQPGGSSGLVPLDGVATYAIEQPLALVL